MKRREKRKPLVLLTEGRGILLRPPFLRQQSLSLKDQQRNRLLVSLVSRETVES